MSRPPWSSQPWPDVFPERHPPVLHPQSTPPQLLPERQTHQRSVQEYRLYLLRIGQTLLGGILGRIRTLWSNLVFGHHVEGFFGIGWVRTARRPRVLHYGTESDPRHLAWVYERVV